jgi:diguanylate cyclase (GGDEF)-like protein
VALKSLSTRIILFVFVSTLFTAVLVSWLAISSIRNDVRTRTEERAFAVIGAQRANFARVFPDGSALEGASDCGSENVDLQPDLARAAVGSEPGKGDQDCLPHSTLLSALQPSAASLDGMRLLVANQTGKIIAAAGVRSQARVGHSLPASLARPNDPSADALVRYEDQTGNRLVGVRAPLAGTNWLLVAETEYLEAYAPALTTMSQIFIVDVCIILLFSVLATKITLAIREPIEALSLAARKVGDGHFHYQIPTPANRHDELGLLIHTFNDMMEKIRSSQIEIQRDRSRLAEKNEELQQANEILAQLSITDGLTKLHNHRYFQDHLTREIKRVGRTDASLALILLDIDDFKLLNDSHGHAAGDEVLVSLASIMMDSARESDLIARYGGEEFVVLMPNTDLAGAVHLAEKIRMTVESTRLIIGDNMKPIEITISVGVAIFTGNRREFFGHADRALYQAKAAGKNCVIIAGADAQSIA